MSNRGSKGTLVLLMVLLAGCGTSPAPGQSHASGMPASATTAGVPKDLVGLWKLAAAGEEPGTVLRISDSSRGEPFSIWRRCSEVFGMWAADVKAAFGWWPESTDDALTPRAEFAIAPKTATPRALRPGPSPARSPSTTRDIQHG